MKIIIVLITLVSLGIGEFLITHKEIDESIYLNEIAPGIEFSEKRGFPPHYESTQGIVAFNSYDVVPSIRGYAGPIKVLIAINREGIITGLRILEHRETQNYVHYMLSPDYLSQFLGKSISDPFEVGRDIDAISRATVSVKALAQTIRDSSREIARSVYGMNVSMAGGLVHEERGWMIYVIFFAVTMVSYFILRQQKRFHRIRDVTMIAGIVIMGIYLTTPFSIIHVYNLLLRRFSSSILWYVLIISILGSMLIAGRFYCGWMCPFGAIAEFTGRIPSRKWDISPGLDAKWRRLKYLILCVLIPLVLITGRIEYGNFETYVTLFSLHGNVLMWVLVALMIIINLRVRRFWCRYLCPVGALSGLLARSDRRYVSRKDCPMDNPLHPPTSECIRCNRCLIFSD